MKLDYKRTIYVGMAFLGISSFWQLYDVTVPLLLEQVFALNKTVTGFIMSLDNVLALFLLPLFGAWSDRTHSRFGKRKPFIFVGSVIASLGLFAIPLAAQAGNFLAFNLGLAVVLLATAIYRSPAIALMPDVTPKPLRSRANAIINLMGAVGAMLALVALGVLSKKGQDTTYFLPFAAVSVIMLGSLVVLLLTVNEEKMAVKEDEETEEGGSKQVLSPAHRKFLLFLLLSIALWFMAYNGITTAFSRYAMVVWSMDEGQIATSLMIATVTAIVSYIPSGLVASKFGRRKAIFLGLFAMSGTYILGTVLQDFSFLTYLSFALMGLGWAFINVNSLPLLVDICHAGDIGKYTGMYYTASMAGQIVTPILSGFLMEQLGYEVLFPYALVCAGLAFVTMFFVTHGESRAEIKSGLEQFDVEG